MEEGFGKKDIRCNCFIPNSWTKIKCVKSTYSYVFSAFLFCMINENKIIYELAVLW